MSTRKRQPNVMTVRPEIADKIRALCAEYPDGGDWREYAQDILHTYLLNYRSGKPLALPEERFTERNGEREWDGVCL